MGALFGSKFFRIAIAGFVLLAGIMAYFYFSNEGVATEFRQIRQPRPNLFYVGIDVSATIGADMLNDFKNNVIGRVRNFIGDNAASYHIDSFGNPGCGPRSVISIFSGQSPEDEADFEYKVEKKIGDISAAEKPKPGRPLTTPLYYLLAKVLGERPGGRIIIFSDLLNEDSDCARQYPFPEKAISKFGESKTGQIIFICPAPHELKIQAQQEFIARMRKLGSEGKVRVFFYSVPDDPEKRSAFMQSQLRNAIPATTFELVWERVSRVVDTIVSAVRG